MKPPHRSLLVAPLLLGLGACGLVQLGDSLNREMTPQQAAVCRQVVAEEIAREGISMDQVRLIHYQRMTPQRRGSKGQNEGFEAWVYPKKEGPGAFIVELSPTCRFRDAWYHTGRSDASE